MIVVRLRGGLGNQLFQYAAGRALAIKHAVPLKLDPSSIGIDPQRSYRLNLFKIEGEISERSDYVRLAHGSTSPLRHIAPFLGLKTLRKLSSNITLTEASMPYDERIETANPPLILDGYWQSEKYFKHQRQAILDDLELNYPPSPRDTKLIAEMASVESISIHIRRGDYVTNSVAAAYHGILGLDYYERAVEYVKARIRNPRFYVFSDDIAWARENLSLEGATFIEGDKSTPEHDDLRLMSRCRHNIVANSSFSWWGAWLNQNEGAIVIAPERWFKADVDTSDLIPERWIRL